MQGWGLARPTPQAPLRTLDADAQSSSLDGRAAPSSAGDEIKYLDIPSDFAPSDAHTALSTPSEHNSWLGDSAVESSDDAANYATVHATQMRQLGARGTSGATQRRPHFTQPVDYTSMRTQPQMAPQDARRGLEATANLPVPSLLPSPPAHHSLGHIQAGRQGENANVTPLRAATTRTTRSMQLARQPGAPPGGDTPLAGATRNMTLTSLEVIPEDSVIPLPPSSHTRGESMNAVPLRSGDGNEETAAPRRVPLAALAVSEEVTRDPDEDEYTDTDAEADEDGAPDEDSDEDKENTTSLAPHIPSDSLQDQRSTQATMIRVPLHQYLASRTERPSTAAGWIAPSTSYETMRDGWILVKDSTGPQNAPTNIVGRASNALAGDEAQSLLYRPPNPVPGQRASGSTSSEPASSEALASAQSTSRAPAYNNLPFTFTEPMGQRPINPSHAHTLYIAQPQTHRHDVSVGMATTMSSQLTPMALSNPIHTPNAVAGPSTQPTPTAQSLPLTPVPEEGFPLVYRDDPEALVTGLDPERLRQWWQQPMENTLLLQLFGEGYPRIGQARQLTEQITQIIHDITGESNFVVAAPERNWATQDNGQRTYPSTWCIQGLSPQAVLLLTERRVWSTPIITMMAYRRALHFPRFLMTVQGFAHNTNNDVENTVRATIMSEQFLVYTTQLVQLNPLFRSLNARDFATSLLQNAEVRVLSLQNSNIIANIFIDSPTNSIERWREWRDVLSRLPFSSPINTTGWAKRLSPCRGCHGADHPTHMCPFPELQEWHGRSMAPAIPQFGPPMPGQPGDDPNQQSGIRGTRRRRDDEDGDDDAYWRDRQGGAPRGSRRGNLRGRRGRGGF